MHPGMPAMLITARCFGDALGWLVHPSQPDKLTGGAALGAPTLPRQSCDAQINRHGDAAEQEEQDPAFHRRLARSAAGAAAALLAKERFPRVHVPAPLRRTIRRELLTTELADFKPFDPRGARHPLSNICICLSPHSSVTRGNPASLCPVLLHKSESATASRPLALGRRCGGISSTFTTTWS